MCGISGALVFKPNRVPVATLVAMNQQIRHRGPDDEGYYVWQADGNQLVLAGADSLRATSASPNYLPVQEAEVYSQLTFSLGLAHRRLAIVDLSPLGHQPLANQSGEYWISFNGEVYNYQEIRTELSKLGHTFISQSDTEVIVAAYQEWGAACLSRFNGMFAFLIWDKPRRQLFIARDRFGVKPLYYYQNDYGIFFASEIKQFTVVPGWQAKLNHQRAYDFLAYGLTDHSHETLFADVYQLRGGECGIIQLGAASEREPKLQLSRWYQLPLNDYTASYQQACHDFKHIFNESIRLRLRADVPIGSCLSGGLDSSAIVMTMNAQFEQTQPRPELHTFTAASREAAYDESDYARIVATASGASAHFCYPELSDLFCQVKTMTWHQDEPFGSTSIYAQWSVFHAARRAGLKVMLDGQGADEQLYGYHGLYFQVALNQALSRGQIVKFSRELKDLVAIHRFNWQHGMLKAGLNLMPDAWKQKVGRMVNKAQYQLNWLNAKVLNYKQRDPYRATGFNSSNLQQTAYAQVTANNLPMLLHWEDRDSMAHSIESRVPFLDYRLVELILALPDDYKFGGGVTKRVLRDALADNLPREIAQRMTKLGFVTPEEVWLRNNPQFFKDQLCAAIAASGGIFDQAAVMQRFEQILAKQLPFDFWLWRVINFGVWMEVFNVKV